MLSEETQEKVFTISISALSIIGLIADMLGIGKLAYDVVVEGDLDNLPFKILILFLAFAFGAGLGIISIRGFDNTTIPMVSKYLAWLHIVIICASYIGIALILNKQEYSVQTYIAFIAVLISELITIVGLHVVIEELDLNSFAIPILAATLFHIILISFNYVFQSAVVSSYLLGDLLLFLGMSIVGSAMLGDIGFVSMIKKIANRISN